MMQTVRIMSNADVEPWQGSCSIGRRRASEILFKKKTAP